MTVAGLIELEVPSVDVVREWRLKQLVRAGYADEDATQIVFYLDVDLHQATALVRRGCPSSIAVEILL